MWFSKQAKPQTTVYQLSRIHRPKQAFVSNRPTKIELKEIRQAKYAAEHPELTTQATDDKIRVRKPLFAFAHSSLLKHPVSTHGVAMPLPAYDNEPDELDNPIIGDNIAWDALVQDHNNSEDEATESYWQRLMQSLKARKLERAEAKIEEQTARQQLKIERDETKAERQKFREATKAEMEAAKQQAQLENAELKEQSQAAKAEKRAIKQQARLDKAAVKELARVERDELKAEQQALKQAAKVELLAQKQAVKAEKQLLNAERQAAKLQAKQDKAAAKLVEPPIVLPEKEAPEQPVEEPKQQKAAEKAPKKPLNVSKPEPTIEEPTPVIEPEDRPTPSDALDSEDTLETDHQDTPAAPRHKTHSSASVTARRFIRSIKQNLKLPKLYRTFTRHYGILSLALIAIVGAQSALLADQTVGIYAVVLSIAILTVLAIAKAHYRTTMIAAAVLQIATLLILCLPQKDYFTQTVIFYAVILILSLIYRYLFTLDVPRSKTAIGLPLFYLVLLPCMLVTGQIFGVWQYLALHTHFPFHDVPLALMATAYIFFGVVEEIYFRGLLQATSIREMGSAQSVILSTVLFSVSFLNSATLWGPAIGLAMGLSLSLMYVFRRNLVLTIVANASAKILFLWLVVAFN